MYVFHVGMIGMFDLAMFMSLCVNVIGYVVSVGRQFSGACGVGVS